MWTRERMDEYLREKNMVVSASNRQWLRVQLRREADKKRRDRRRKKK